MCSICRVCNTPSQKPIFSGTLLGNKADYFDCSNCGFVQTQIPTWLGEAYASPINANDTGILWRNQTCAKQVLASLATLGNKFDRVVDFAGGYGILVRLLRDMGIDAYWEDPYCQNLVAKGFENRGKKARLVTAFEVLEHLTNPKEELERIFATAPNALFSTTLISRPAPPFKDWWYYGTSHGQHVGFYRVETLTYLAKHFGKHLITDGSSLHLMTENPVSAWRWRANLKLAQRLPRLLTRSLRSKIWPDHEKMSQK